MVRHILLISIDNLRYDCIGYQTDKRELIKHDVLKYLQTPALDSFAEKSLCFTECVSTNTYTTAAHASVFTGLYPPRHGLRAFYEAKLSRDVHTLAEVLKVYGYETVLMTDVPDLFVPLELDRGFNHLLDGDDEALVRFLEDNRERKLFAFIHFFDVHEPFLCRKYAAAGDGPVSKPLRDPEYLDAVRTLYHTFHLQMGDCESDDTNYRSLWTRLLDHIGDKRHEHFFPLYVRGVTKFDRGRFRNFAERLSSSGLLDESLTIVFSDHGEGRSSTHDPDIFAHGGALYDSVIRVPLMVHHPDLSPRITDDVVSLVDIFPTIMNSCAVEDVTSALPYALDGANLLETGKRGSRYVYSETWQRDNRNQNIPLPLVSSLLEQRSLRSKTRKCVINGSRDSFPERGAWGEMDDETFAQQAYRCLYGRYESLDEYRRTVEGLKEGRISREKFIRALQTSHEYLSGFPHRTFDLLHDPFEEHPIEARESGRDSEAFEVLRGMATTTAQSLPVFDDGVTVTTMENALCGGLSGRIAHLLRNRHVRSLIIGEFLRTRKGEINSRKDAEELLRSPGFGQYLIDRLFPGPVNSPGGSDYAVRRELDEIKRSITWKTMRAVTGFVDTRIFPAGSARGRLWERLLAGLGGVGSGGNEYAVSRLLERLRSSDSRKKVMVITYEAPRFDTYSGANRFSHLVTIMADLGFMVTVICDNPVKVERYAKPMEEQGITILYGTGSMRYFEEMGKHYDCVVLHTPATIGYLDSVKRYFKKAVIIFDTSDLHYLRFQREAAITGDAASLIKSLQYKEQELSLVRKSDIVWVVSETEKELLLRDVGDARIAVVPNVHRIQATAVPFEKRRDILFIGSFAHRPNGDAVAYFLREIFPLVLEEIDLNFYVIGSNPVRECHEHQGPNVIFTGHVLSVEPYFEKCRLMVAPLRYGAGVKGKLTQSMSLGLPFVTSSVGAEGMDLVDGRHCFIADDPRLFAEKTVALYNDKTAWSLFRHNALKHATERYSYDVVKEKVKEVLSR